MLSNTSRLLTFLTGILYAVLDFLLFFLPQEAVGIPLIFVFRRLGTGAST